MNCLKYLFFRFLTHKIAYDMKRALIACLLMLSLGGFAMAQTTAAAQAPAGKGKPGMHKKMHKKHHHKHHHAATKKHM
jgi:hypothetical protein